VIIARRRVYAQRYGVGLSGPIDGVNQTYTAPDKFNASAHAVYYNGQRLYPTVDYSIVESGGPGSGYDTINVMVVPREGDYLIVDYTLA
jgi:hypothetical protein